MNKEPASSNAISEAALKVCSLEEIRAMPRPPRMNLLILIERRLNKPGPPPTQDELVGIKELATEHLWHPAFNQLSVPSPDSTTTS